MSTAGQFVDFARLNAPIAIEALDYEAQLEEAKAKLADLLPQWDVHAIEGDPANKVMEVACYLDLLLRARVNDAIKSMLLAYAVGSDLDHLGANINVERLAGESDERYRGRVQTGLWAHTATGNPAAYRWHAMSVSTDVHDVAVEHSQPGRVDVIALAHEWAETALADPQRVEIGDALFPDLEPPHDTYSALLCEQDSSTHAAIREAVMADDVAPLTDHVNVTAPQTVLIPITAVLYLHPGPDETLVLDDAREGLNAYLLSIRRCGYDCTRSGLLDALTVSGVRTIALTEPAADVELTAYQLAVATPVNLSVAGVRDV